MAVREHLEEAPAREAPTAPQLAAPALGLPIAGTLGVDQVINLQQSAGNAAVSTYLGGTAAAGAPTAPAPAPPPPGAPAAAGAPPAPAPGGAVSPTDAAIMDGLRAAAGGRTNRNGG